MIDFKDWKKTKEDKLGVEMMHPKGHSLYILYKGVPMIQREALKRLPLSDGGDVKGVHKSDYDQSAKDIKNKIDKRIAGQSKAGEHVQNEDIRPGSKEKAKSEHHRVLGEIRSMPNPKIKGFKGGGVAHTSMEQEIHDKGLKGGPDTYEPVSADDFPVNYQEEEQSAQQVAPQPAAQAPATVSTAAQQGSVPVNPLPPTVSAAAPSALLPNGSMSAPGAAQLAQQANAEQAQTDIAKAHAMVPVEEAKLIAQKEQAQRDQNNVDMLRKHTDTMANTLKNIDPKNYVNNMSSPQKVSTAIGLALGAFSQPFGGHNFTGDYLNKQIDRDIDAQKANNENQKTIFGAYQQLYGDQNVASKMAKASMADIYASQAATIAQKLGTPQALANYHKIQSDLSITKNKAIMDAAGNLRDIPNNPNGQQGGASGASATSPGKPESNGKGVEDVSYRILKPGAEEQISNMIRYNPSLSESEKSKLQSQITQATQAQKSLKELQNTFEHLVAASREGGWSGRIQRRLSPHALAGAGAGVGTALGGPAGAAIGTAIGEGVGQGAHILTDTDMNRRYDSDKTRLLSYVSSAVPGRGSELIQDLVNKNTPEYKDDTATLKRKLEAIKEFIQNHTETDALKRHGLSYR